MKSTMKRRHDWRLSLSVTLALGLALIQLSSNQGLIRSALPLEFETEVTRIETTHQKTASTAEARKDALPDSMDTEKTVDDSVADSPITQKNNETMKEETKEVTSTAATKDIHPDVVELSKHLPEGFAKHESGMTVAMCHKTLFGKIDLTKIMKWAAFHRFLSVDHIYIWYLPSHVNETVPGFEELRDLPYVSLLPNDKAKLSWYGVKKYWELVGSNGERDGPGGQQSLEMECLRLTSNFTWTLNSDADEFFWYKRKSIGSVKDFLQPYTDSHYYLSFSKRMHSLNFRSKEAVPDTGFGLDGYGFTHDNYYCLKSKVYQTKTGSSYCPGWVGSAKLFVKPKIFLQNHKLLETHGVLGISQVEKRNGTKIFHAYDARFFEFPSLFNKHDVIEVPQNETYKVYSGKEASMSFFEKAYSRNPDGSMTLHYDPAPDKWFQYVLQRGVGASHSPDKEDAISFFFGDIPVMRD